MAEHFVKFNIFCRNCEYKETPEVEDPCNECLANPVNEDSRKPVNYKKKEDK